MTSNYNPDFYNKRLSESIADVAKERLDEMGYSHLKKEIDDALFNPGEAKPDVKLGESSKGFVI